MPITMLLNLKVEDFCLSPFYPMYSAMTIRKNLNSVVVMLKNTDF